MLRSQPLLGSMPTISKFIIHPPLPLNPRESEQLLKLLTTSFRKQLDAAHGLPPIRSSFRKDPGSGLPLSSQQYQNAKKRKGAKPSSRSPTDLHLSSILANPLFGEGLSDAKKTSDRDPMDTFQLAVSKGMMTIHWAKLCLEAKKEKIIQSSKLSIAEGMKESGAGGMVLSWLIASGMTSDNRFMTNWSFTQILMQFLVAENRQEVVWKWVKRSFEELPHYADLPNSLKGEARKNLSRPLLLLVTAEEYVSGSGALDSAYICVSRAAGYLKGKAKLDMRIALGSAGSYLSHATTSMSARSHQTPSESAFDSFLSLVPVISNYPEYHFAHLNLHHPSRPSADLALSYLRKNGSVLNRVLEERKIRHLIELGLNTAKFLFEKEKVDEADWVMDYLQSNFSDRLGARENMLLEQSKAEAANIQLLESLSFA